MAKQKRLPKVTTQLKAVDLEDTQRLTDVLFQALNENNAACARVLGVSRKTWMQMSKQIDDWPWWNFVLREAITMVISSITAKRGVTERHKRNLKAAMSRIPQRDRMAFNIASRTTDLGGAEAYLRRKLTKKPRKRSWILSAANSGGYSRQALEAAARSLEVKKKQFGYGADKDSIWSLPDEAHFSRDLSEDTREDQKFIDQDD